MSASKRKKKREPGKKRGAKIGNTLAVIPLGIRSNRPEIQARMSLRAIGRGIVTEDHIVNLLVFSELSRRIGGQAHIDVHAATIKRLCDRIRDDGYKCDNNTFFSLEASSGVLLNFINAQKNYDIASHAMKAVSELPFV